MGTDWTNINTEYYDVTYKQYKDIELTMDIYFPSSSNQHRPVFLYVHGGGFLWYDKSLVDEDHRINHVNYKRALLEHGFVFISIEYRRVHTKEYPCLIGQIEDIKDGIIWIKEHAIDLGIDPNNIGLWGLSAGGALALAAALNPDENYNLSSNNTSSSVSYVIDFFGITDIMSFYKIETLGSASIEEQNKIKDLVYRHANIKVTNEHQVNKVKEVVDPHSPIHNISQCNVHVSIFHGTHDTVVPYHDNALEFYNKYLSKGNSVRLYPYHKKDHGFWWDTLTFYENLQNRVISDIIDYSSMSQKDI